MYCTKCGASRPEGMSICPNCGTVAQVPPPPAAAAPATPAAPGTIQNYLVPAILVTLCCCVPAGVVAIVYAAQVNSKLAAGDIAGAQESARMAKIWSWVGFGFGVVIAIVYGIIGGLGALKNLH